MPMSELTRKFAKELNSGTTALALMAILVRRKQAMYGYELGMELAGMSDDGLPMNQGALYPVLRSLERAGLLSSEMQPSNSGPARRYYKPTALGRAEFKLWRETWIHTRDWLDEVLESKHGQAEQHPERPARRS